jgi:hypothetical protein
MEKAALLSRCSFSKSPIGTLGTSFITVLEMEEERDDD